MHAHVGWLGAGRGDCAINYMYYEPLVRKWCVRSQFALHCAECAGENFAVYGTIFRMTSCLPKCFKGLRRSMVLAHWHSPVQRFPIAVSMGSASNCSGDFFLSSSDCMSLWISLPSKQPPCFAIPTRACWPFVNQISSKYFVEQIALND